MEIDRGLGSCTPGFFFLEKKSVLAGPEIFPRFEADLEFQKSRCRLKGRLLLHKYLLVSKRTIDYCGGKFGKGDGA